MVDKLSKEQRSRNMAAIKSKNTMPELQLRSALWERGLRFRKHYGREKIDIAFPSDKLAIFVDGCFWHSCPIHGHVPKSNCGYWGLKLLKNKERDEITTKRLVQDGWAVLRLWEHELEDMDQAINKIQLSLKKRDTGHFKNIKSKG
jgi:DNA mismatch endonuclease (patch repair protein)